MNPSSATSRAVTLDEARSFGEPVSPAVSGESECGKCEAPTRGLLSLLLIVMMRGEMSFPPRPWLRNQPGPGQVQELMLVNAVRSCVLSGRSSEEGLGLLPGNSLSSWLCFKEGHVCPQPPQPVTGSTVAGGLG